MQQLIDDGSRQLVQLPAYRVAVRVTTHLLLRSLHLVQRSLQLALAHLLGGELCANEQQDDRRIYDLRPHQPTEAPKAKAVLHLFMNGGPSQMDLFDPTVERTRRLGESYFDKIAGEIEFIPSAGALMKSPYKFQQHGELSLIHI